MKVYNVWFLIALVYIINDIKKRINNLSYNFL